MTINDFYKGYGDGCFYLSNIDLESDIQPKELTITFISNSYPDKMIRHLKNFRPLSLIPESSQNLKTITVQKM